MREIITVLMGILLLVLCVVVLSGNYFFNRVITRKGIAANVEQLQNADGVPDFLDFTRLMDKEWWERNNAQRVFIESQDNLRLSGLYVKNHGGNNKVAILVHGYSASAKSMVLYAPTYYNMGFDVLAVDNRAHGESEGKYVGMGYLDSKDLLNWIDEVIKRKGDDCQIVLHGVSMGATTVDSMADKGLKNVKAIISDCAYDNAEAIYTHLMKVEYGLGKFPLVNALNVVCKIRAGYYLSDANIISNVANSQVPILYFHGNEDTFVPVSMSKKLYAATPKHLRDICIVDKAGHGAAIIVENENYINRMKAFVEKLI